jgi:DNA replication licensing factor MCM5
LSRFDLIFIVRDLRNEKRDQALASHIIQLHQNRDQVRSHARAYARRPLVSPLAC